MNCLFMQHVSDMNVLAVFVSAVLSFFLGSFWFGALFGRIWVKELEKHKVTIKQPTSKVLMQKMGLTLLGNMVASFAMAFLVHLTGSTTLCTGLHLGCLVAIGFIATSMAISYVWVSKSIKLSLINIGYPAVGAIVTAIILSLWR